MNYRYGEFAGIAFPSPDSLFPSPKVIDFILQWGDQAMDAMAELDDEQQQFIEQMIDAGLFERDEKTGTMRLTPRMLRGIQNQALLEIFQGLQRGSREGHETLATARSDERTDGTKPYVFGDPVSELDITATMRNAMHRVHAQPNASIGESSGAALPIKINIDDFELHQSEGQSDVALCLVLDMSGSMMRWGRFYQAKRVALGMEALIRDRFPQDTIDYVGFYSTACKIPQQQMPLVMPKPVTIHDHQVRLRVPLDQATKHAEKIPQHFTNLQLGLRLARQILSRRGAPNKQIFVITDGQPTAHVEAGKGGEMLYLLYPPTERTATTTLKEAWRCQQQGIRIATFALIEDYWGMDWVGFVDQLTRLTRGMSFYCTSEDLSSTVIESYLSGRKKKSFIT